MENVIRLQGIGLVNAKRADTLKEGDIIYWNYGYRSEVKAIISQTTKSKVYALQSLDSEYGTHSRRLLNNRLVAVK